MSSSFNSRRSFRSFKSVFGSNQELASFKLSRDEWESNHNIEQKTLVSLQLPPSLATLDKMSPALWSWVHSGDFTRAISQSSRVNFNHTLVFSPAGERVEIPLHLIDVGENEFDMPRHDPQHSFGLEAPRRGAGLSRAMTMASRSTSSKRTR